MISDEEIKSLSKLKYLIDSAQMAFKLGVNRFLTDYPEVDKLRFDFNVTSYNRTKLNQCTVYYPSVCFLVPNGFETENPSLAQSEYEDDYIMLDNIYPEDFLWIDPQKVELLKRDLENLYKMAENMNKVISSFLITDTQL